MSYQYFRKNMKLAVIPMLLMSVLFVLMPSLTSQTSIMIIPSGAVTIGAAFIMYRKKSKEVDL
jgi:Na+-transporting NADH:ubiquinone oxidoreductase subunit NqrB